MKRIIIAGGGTGGHVLAGVALATEWKSRFPQDSEVLFIGARGCIEERLVPRAGFVLKTLSLGGINRVGVIRKLKTLLQLPLAHLLAAKWIFQFKPDFVVGVGGYSSGPVLLAAWLLRKGLFKKFVLGILEQNSVPGFTNRKLSIFSDLVFTAFPDGQRQFPGRRVVFAGNPVRAEFWQTRKVPDLRGGSGVFSLFVFGGSQGAMGMNTLVMDMLPHLSKLIDLGRLKVVHQTGKKDFERMKVAYEPWREKLKSCRVVEFIDDMAGEYRDASLVICRAGSSSLAEIAAVGRASILVPLPTSSDGHQKKNAEALVQLGAAFLVDQRTATGRELAERIADLLSHPEKLRKVEEAVMRLAVPDACGRMIDSLLEFQIAIP